MCNRIAWLDMLRGACMLAILWFHTEMYYAGSDIVPYACYVGDALAVFFFISGYLLFTGRPVAVRHKLWGIGRWLVVPYLVFTSVIALPKALVHHTFEGFGVIAADILSGNASWFVSALIVAELMFVGALHIGRNHKSVAPVLAVAMVAAAALVGNAYAPFHYEQNLWHFNEATLGCALMAAGYIVHEYEATLLPLLRRRATLVLLVAAFVLCKWAILSTDAQMIFGPVITDNFPLFIADIVVAVALAVALATRLPHLTMLEWVGQRTLVYYFVCGGVPLLVGKGLAWAGLPYTSYALMFPAYALVCLAATIIVWLTHRYTGIVRNVPT